MFSTRSSFADHYVVPTGSMRPTVEVGDRIFVNKLAYGLHVPFMKPYLVHFADPERGDVVVLDSPVEDVTLLKRVVAVPGDRVEVTAGKVHINGRELETEHPIRLTNGGGPALAPTVVPADHYLVLGDNRGESADGRYFGFVERERLRGRAVAIYFHDGGFVWDELRR